MYHGRKGYEKWRRCMAPNPNYLVRLNKSHVTIAAEALALAFYDYQLLKHAFPDDSERKRIASYVCQSVLHYGIRYGEVYATSMDIEGVVASITSDYFPMTFWRMIRSIPLSVMAGLGRGGGSRLRHPADYMDAMHKRLAPFKHWFLMIIGVVPQFQGEGFTSKLIHPMLDRIDEQELPCYVETMDGKNVGLYEHFGFRVVEKFAIPETELTTWAMLRDARKASAPTQG